MFFSAVVLGLAATTSLVLPVLAQSTCNGQSAYCDRIYSNVTQVGAHDSPFVGPLLQQNQNIDVTEQLDLGIRFLQGQTHQSIDNDTILLCHTSCLLEYAGSLESYLATVKAWLDDNPDEVVTLLLTNGDSLPVTHFAEAFESAAIADYAFVPKSSPSTLAINAWPTLRELIGNGTRLITFLDYGADATAVPYILDEFAYFFETPYDVTDASFPTCSIDRPSGASATGRMYIVNHFLDVDILGILIPDREHAAETNAVSSEGSIGAQADLCLSIYGQLPNVILLDFVDQGQPIAAQSLLNGV
ncbi:PLC-like phosphodiesterase [Aspergillus uvarum CBS 121591]|uniref:PLC-like phosphodiesterase n=1 Tax=Aspergillus uvarum CBS 121591 TaxID=1448315 RepID=A0A319CAW2_9EURO|nr:PLC-like phosphodiesterase [Aspergillus uvarum CBS 121591]PYH82946.1 PLC-like phosphodiesterase [Aspergillus uvarum CBS 121591]